MPLLDKLNEQDFLIAYDDDPDPERAGQGLISFSLIKDVLGGDDMRYWMMTPAEQVAILFLLERLRPPVAIEIGTRFGGSLQAISRLSKKVYSIDIDPQVPRRLAGLYPNVEYLIGKSDDILPPLLERLMREEAKLSFVLVDGDHSTSGVQGDIDSLLRFQPTVPLYIVMHDSFNPECRNGLRKAHWELNSHVHAVELDFVAGIVHPSPAFLDQLWGGLALGILLPQSRTGRFEITAKSERTYETAMKSLRPKRSFLGRALGRAKRALVN